MCLVRNILILSTFFITCKLDWTVKTLVTYDYEGPLHCKAELFENGTLKDTISYGYYGKGRAFVTFHLG